MRKIFNMLSVLLLLGFTTVAQNSPRTDFLLKKLKDGGKSNYVMIVAHRGDWRNAPENSLQAFQNCIDKGVDIIEIDVQRTKDGELVVIHDQTLNRTTNGIGKVADFDFSELKKLNLRSGNGLVTEHRIPSLKEVFELCKGKILIQVDKWPAVKDDVLSLAERLGCLDQLIFRSTNNSELVKQQFGDYLAKINYIPVITANGKLDKAKLTDFKSTLKVDVLSLAFDKDNYSIINEFKILKNENYRVWYNAVEKKYCGGHDDELAISDLQNSYGWLVANGANIIMTDRPLLLLAYLAKSGKRINN